VIVADSQPIYARGLAEAITRRPDLEMVGTAGDLQEAIDEIAIASPDVAVIEQTLVGGLGQTLIGQISAQGSGTSVILLWAGNDGASMYEAVEAGAAGCISKETDAEETLDAIAAVGRGEVAFCSRSVESITKQIRLQHQRDEVALSERERDILGLIADGLSSKRVGSELALSQSTVKNHLSQIYAKLGVTCAAAAVSQAIRLDLLS
jgi:DNA-binding NarL/FixJ family response regulator